MSTSKMTHLFDLIGLVINGKASSEDSVELQACAQDITMLQQK